MAKPFQKTLSLSSLDCISKLAKQELSIERQEKGRVKCWKKRHMTIIMVSNSSCRISLKEITVTIKLKIVKVMFFLERKN